MNIYTATMTAQGFTLVILWMTSCSGIGDNLQNGLICLGGLVKTIVITTACKDTPTSEGNKDYPLCNITDIGPSFVS